MKIKNKLFIYFAGIFLFFALSINLMLFFGLPFIDNTGFYSKKKKAAFKSLNHISRTKEVYIKSFIEKLKQNAHSLGESQHLKLLLIDFLKNSEDSKENSKEKINDILDIFKSSYNNIYNEIQIFDEELIFSTNKNASNQIVPPKKNFELFINQNKKSMVFFNQQKINDSVHMGMDIFRKVEIYHDNSLITFTLVFHVDSKLFIDKNIHSGEELGETGEVILLDDESKLLTPLKFPLKNGTIVKPFDYAMKNMVSNMAASGMAGAALITDYRGKVVFSTYRSMYLDDGITFVIITKKDKDEIFENLNECFLNSILLSFLFTLIVLFLINLICKAITFPISNLVKKSKRIKDDNYLEKLSTESENELSPLVLILNDLICKFQNLEKVTNERKDEDKTMYEEKLLKLKDSAENATRLKDKFVSLVAHDLRSPIGSIAGLLKLLLKKGVNSEHYQVEIIETIIKSVKKMELLISDILNISRVKSGKIIPNLAFINLFELIDTVVDQHNPKALAKGIEIKNEINVNTRIYSDKALFGQVIDNIISNAIKFCMKKDTITISEEKGEQFALKITDTGTGINPKIVEDLFKFDKKTSMPGTAGEIGTGLGLPFAYELMTAMSGDLTVSSVQSSGSTFYASLPNIKPKILVVDDESLFRASITILLQAIDADIIEAENGEEALSIIEGNKPTLIIADINMPVMDGFKLLKILKSDKILKFIPVIIVTSLTGIEVRDNSFLLGADDFINKPFKAEELIPRVRRFLC